MTITKFPNGLSSWGVPILGGSSIPTTTGNYFFVDSGTGAAGNNGLDPAEAVATIDQAVNLCTASNGDVIIVFPGHSETIASATSLVVDVAGIQIIGLGQGRNRPLLSFSATASRIPVSADNVTISNLVFDASIAAIVSGVTVTGDNVTIENCEWNLDATGVEFLQMLDIDATTRTTIRNCKFIAENIAGCNNAIRTDANAYLSVVGCEFRGDFTTAAVTGNAGSAAASTDSYYGFNFIENRDTTAGLTIDVHDDTTGIATDNRAFTLFATAPETALDTGAMLACENYVVNAVDESGTIAPTVLST